MTEHELYHFRYPTGKFVPPDHITQAHLHTWLADIQALPAQLRTAVETLSEAQLETPYRPEGWTVRQVVHHLADSHLNAYTRCKLALTEDNPTIKPYEEQHWAELTDGKTAPIALSLSLLDALHSRWILLLKSLSDTDWQKTFYHPGSQQTVSLKEAAGTYSWHGQHHLAHITGLKKREGWL